MFMVEIYVLSLLTCMDFIPRSEDVVDVPRALVRGPPTAAILGPDVL